MALHTVLIGYGDTGRVVLAALNDNQRALGVTVVEPDPERAELAKADGAKAVGGHGWHVDTLLAAAAQDACHVIIAVTDDAMALRITAIVRSLSEDVTITAVVRNADLAELIEYLGADHVLSRDCVIDWFYAADREGVDGAHRNRDRAWQARDLDLAVAERTVHDREVGRSPVECGPSVLAVVRDGHRIWPDDPVVARLRHDDRLVVLCESAPDR